ncbi:hypothetical protein BAUCODRAFT_33191 [Baudoinia panamericana UAMH 10762]|uniref:Late embryogenesis abundant protein LEA-2 subgroup domain-containing protein n=1 Tax=Baudoinia panamericana (strain UAMH 10762) TaxID=717646 RepID=M2NE33_BAUPA|nr:uncharacterized protein BAUCODRAFT_33191 [Baudoinia panamericana UAMH 10762]EMC97474.1 hypothetical protein BAUCODRAFT_33191 [Baudoinia panamericana UAMH 10762]
MAANGEQGGRREEESRDVDGEAAATEQTPLLPSSTATVHDDTSQPQHEVPAERSLLASLRGGAKGTKRRWPSILALSVLCILVVLIIVFAFLAPSTVEQYAQQAVVFEPTSLSIDSFTSTGIKARVQGDFTLDARRVQKKPVRDLGKFFTYIARQAESGESEVEVSLPEYGNVVLGTARIPGIKVDLRAGHTTHVDFLSDLQPGDVDGIRRIANDWIEGRLGQLRVLGKARVPVRSGVISLGKQVFRHEMLFANKDIPSIPAYDFKKLNVREIDLPRGGKGMAADVSLLVQNDYPIDFTVPPMAFNILVDNCQKTDPYIKLANAETHDIYIHPKQKVELNATGIVHRIPDLLTQDCPDSNKSPLDILLGKYLHGKQNTIYVQGSASPQLNTPRWVTDLISDLTVPVPLPGKTLGHLIKNFSLTDTHFSMPDPFAEPDTPEGNPTLSANVRALIALPGEMNFNFSVSRVRADAEIFYKGNKLGKLDLRRWQPASSQRVGTSGHSGPTLMVRSSVKDAPLHITNETVLTEVIQDLVFRHKPVLMHIQADVDVEMKTALGELTVRKIPAEGQVPIKPLSRGTNGNNDTTDGLLPNLNPRVFDLKIVETTPTGMTISALVNITNPTDHSATVPYMDVHFSANGSLLGHSTVRNMTIKPGNNTNLQVMAVYDPLTMGGTNATAVGRELLSRYISGYNISITVQMHNGSIPSYPALGQALSQFPIDVSAPRLHSPADDKADNAPHFIRDATFHLFSSTATFTLLSPFSETIMTITSIDANAFYKGDNVGHIDYNIPFAVPPVDADGNGITTPRLPVDWSLGGVGYDAVRGALGGRLKLSAFANVGVKIGQWEERMWYQGRSIGASIRI